MDRNVQTDAFEGLPIDSFLEKQWSRKVKLNSNKNFKTFVILHLMYLPTALLYNVV